MYCSAAIQVGRQVRCQAGGRQADRTAGRQADRQEGRRVGRQGGWNVGRQRYRKTDVQTNIHTNRNKNVQIYKDIGTGTQTNRHTYRQ
jgi:hypothetical protein